ncbi:MAG: UbiX family flavin prenyltransferase [Candidatus Thermoplasmatota archaeon]
MRIVVGITGASGVIYGIRLLENLKLEKHLIISENAKKLLEDETDYKLEDVKKLANYYYENSDLFAKISSGSFKFDAMVIVPCSTSTFSKIANGIADNLITRVASVCLKERRKLIIVPRETPLSTIHLQNLAKLSQENVVVLPAMPAFYHKPKRIDDLVNFVVGRILDAIGIEHEVYKRWGG